MKQKKNIKIKFYSICYDFKEKHEFDLSYLGESILRNIGIAIYSGNGRIWGDESTYLPTTQNDYDKEFYRKLIKVEPAYKAFDFLDYHLNFFLTYNNLKGKVFKDHIWYTILPKFDNSKRNEYYELIKDWLKRKKMDLKKQLKERDYFLERAYETACNYHKASPFSVSLKPVELGASIGFDKEDTQRIVIELVNEGYASSTLGMQALFVTQEGLNYLRRKENMNFGKDSLFINVGDNSSFQFQNKTVNSTQSQQVNYSSINIHELFELIKLDLNELQNEQTEELIAEINNALKHLDKGKDISSRLLTIGSLIKDIGINVFSNLIASPIFELLKPFLGL